MFPISPKRQPTPPNRFLSPRRAMRQQSPTKKEQFISMFLGEDGKLDFEKVSFTVKQINEIYQQVSPMISRFTKK
jgi:hypothetical protein